MVLQAESTQSDAARQAFKYLCTRYWRSIYAFVRYQGRSPHDAEDLAQGFLTKVLETHSIARADPSKGRFRNLLLRMLKDYIVDEIRKKDALKRGGGAGRFAHLPLGEAEEQYLAEPDPGLTPDEVFDRSWAASLMENAYQRLEQEFEAGQGSRFHLLKRFIAETASDSDCVEMAAKLEVTPKSASVAIYRLRARYRECLQDEILATVSDTELVKAELVDPFCNRLQVIFIELP